MYKKIKFLVETTNPPNPEVYRKFEQCSQMIQANFEPLINACGVMGKLRNLLIAKALGIGGAEVVIVVPDSFLISYQGWIPFEELVVMFPDEGYYALPRWEVQSIGFFEKEYACVKRVWTFRDGVETVGLDIPFPAFTKQSDVMFNPDIDDLDESLIDLWNRIGVPGPWTHGFKGKKVESKFVGTVKMAGYVGKLVT